MFETYNSAGYDLYQPFENIDKWVIDCKNISAYSGSLKEVIEFMIKKLDFNFENIENGLMLLADNIRQGHNGCHFGIYKSCIYSFKKDGDYERSA